MGGGPGPPLLSYVWVRSPRGALLAGLGNRPRTWRPLLMQYRRLGVGQGECCTSARGTRVACVENWRSAVHAGSAREAGVFLWKRAARHAERTRRGAAALRRGTPRGASLALVPPVQARRDAATRICGSAFSTAAHRSPCSAAARVSALACHAARLLRAARALLRLPRKGGPGGPNWPSW